MFFQDCLLKHDNKGTVFKHIKHQEVALTLFELGKGVLPPFSLETFFTIATNINQSTEKNF